MDTNQGLSVLEYGEVWRPRRSRSLSSEVLRLTQDRAAVVAVLMSSVLSSLITAHIFVQSCPAQLILPWRTDVLPAGSEGSANQTSTQIAGVDSNEAPPPFPEDKEVPPLPEDNDDSGRALEEFQPGSSRFLIANYPMPGPLQWSNLSQQAQQDFTLQGRVPVGEHFYTDRTTERNNWDADSIRGFIQNADTRDPQRGDCTYGPTCNAAFYSALDAHPIRGSSVLVVGTLKPWLESICISYGARNLTTVDFNKPVFDHPTMKTLSVTEFDALNQTYDVIFSYSSLEHDGLGRYGDPLNPYGDFLRVRKLRKLLKPGGKFFLGVPNGPDFLNFNGHRVYGPIRFPLLIKGWKLLGTYGEDLQKTYVGIFQGDVVCLPPGLPENHGCYTQPVHVLSL